MGKEEILTHPSESEETWGKLEQETLTLSSLHEISKSLLAEHDLQKLLDIIAEKAVRGLGADLVTLYEYNATEDDVKMPPIIKGRSKAIGVLKEKGKVIPHKESTIFKMINRKKPFYAENTKESWVKEGIVDLQTVEREDGFFNREGIVSSAGVPLCIERNVVGVLFVNFREFHRFTSTRIERIEMFANYAALAIRNARIFSKSQQYVKQLSALNEIGQKISSAKTMNIDRILYFVYEQTRALMGVSNFYIAIYDARDDRVDFKLAIEGGKRKKTGVNEYASRKAGNGLTEYIIRKKKPLLLPRNPMDWILSEGLDPIGKEAKSWLGAPMIINNKVLGVIGVQNFNEENAYDEDHRNVLTTIASQTAIAISKANIFKENKKRMRELSALYDTSKEISQKVHDLKSVLLAIVKRAVELSKAQGGTLMLCDHSKKELKVVVNHNLDKLMGLKFSFGNGLAGRVAECGKSLIKNEYYKWRGRLPIFKQKEYKDLVKALVQVPLKSEEKVVGVLAISSSQKNHKFTKDDRDLLERFARSAEIAITNAKTHNYLQALVESTPDAIIAVDTSGIITEFNKASEQVLDFPMKEVVGTPAADYYWNGAKEARRINSLLKGDRNGKIKDIETFVKNKGGEKIPILLAGSVLYNGMGDRIGSVGHMEDMRKIKLLEGRYRALYEVGKVSVELPDSDIEPICQEFMDALTKRELKFIASYICLVDEKDELKLMAVGESGDTNNQKPQSESKTHVLSQIPESWESISAKKVQKNKKFENLEEAKRNINYRFWVIPLTVRDKIIGEMTVFKGNESEFADEEKKFLDRFASLAALVIEKAKDVNRNKAISNALSEIVYDIAELSGADVYGDIWNKVTDIISRRIQDSSVGLYICKSETDRSATLRDTTTDDLRDRLKCKIYPNDTPFKSESKIVSDYLLVTSRSYGLPGKEEGVLLVEKIQRKDGVLNQFNEIERLIIPMLASALGIALYHLRRNSDIPKMNGHS